MENLAAISQNSSPEGISVLMPVHGSGVYLESAIKGVLSQTHAALELLVIFDRPSTECREIVERFQSIDSRVRVIESIYPGISVALNLGLSKSSHEYVARIDADDVMLPIRLSVQANFLTAFPLIDCVGSQVSLIGETILSPVKTCYPERPLDISKALSIRNVIAHPSVVYRKSKVVEVGCYREEYNGAEDYDLWLRLDNGKNLANIHDVLTLYRVHEDQVTAKNSKIQLELDSKVRCGNQNKCSNGTMSDLNSRWTNESELEVADIINATLSDLGSQQRRPNYLRLATVFLRISTLSPKISFYFLKYFVLPNYLNRK